MVLNVLLYIASVLNVLAVIAGGCYFLANAGFHFRLQYLGEILLFSVVMGLGLVQAIVPGLIARLRSENLKGRVERSLGVADSQGIMDATPQSRPLIEKLREIWFLVRESRQKQISQRKSKIEMLQEAAEMTQAELAAAALNRRSAARKTYIECLRCVLPQLISSINRLELATDLPDEAAPS